jgi:hypothetical protein
MKIALVTNLFYPDELAGAALYTDLAMYLKERGHDVRVTCTFGYYPAWQLSERDKGVKVRDEVFNDIPVRRVSMYVPARPSGATRMLSDASFFFSLWLRGINRNWSPDVILTADRGSGLCGGCCFGTWNSEVSWIGLFPASVGTVCSSFSEDACHNRPWNVGQITGHRRE